MVTANWVDRCLVQLLGELGKPTNRWFLMRHNIMDGYITLIASSVEFDRVQVAVCSGRMLFHSSLLCLIQCPLLQQLFTTLEGSLFAHTWACTLL